MDGFTPAFGCFLLSLPLGNQIAFDIRPPGLGAGLIYQPARTILVEDEQSSFFIRKLEIRGRTCISA